jgi:outer membrane protein
MDQPSAVVNTEQVGRASVRTATALLVGGRPAPAARTRHRALAPFSAALSAAFSATLPVAAHIGAFSAALAATALASPAAAVTPASAGLDPARSGDGRGLAGPGSPPTAVSPAGTGIRWPSPAPGLRLAAGAPDDGRALPDAGSTTDGAPTPEGHAGELGPVPPPADSDRARRLRSSNRAGSGAPTGNTSRTTAAIERLILDGREDDDNEFVLGMAISGGSSYSGASDFGYSISPAARFTWRGYSISTQSVARASARVEQNSSGDRTGITGPLNYRNRFGYGFGVSLNRGRNVTAEGAALGLKSLSTTLYGRVRLRYAIDEHTTLSATLVADLLNRQRNMELPIGISRRYVLAERMVFAIEGGINFVNRRSMDNDYGIGAQQSAASGLPVYRPGGGLREVAVSAVLVHEPDDHWIWMTRFSLVRLVGQSTDSPLVRQALQPYLMFGVAYRFTWD